MLTIVNQKRRISLKQKITNLDLNSFSCFMLFTDHIIKLLFRDFSICMSPKILFD